MVVGCYVLYVLVCVCVCWLYMGLYVCWAYVYMCLLGVHVWCMCVGLCEGMYGDVCVCVVIYPCVWWGTCISVCVYVYYVGACEEKKPEQYYLGQDIPTYMSSGEKYLLFFHNITSEGLGGKNQHNKSYQ